VLMRAGRRLRRRVRRTMMPRRTASNLRSQRQVNPVADEVAAVTAAVRPILQGTLFTLKREILDALGGYDNVTLAMLARVYRRGDGDCGICFSTTSG
jgi:hypothetical protein